MSKNEPENAGLTAWLLFLWCWQVLTAWLLFLWCWQVWAAAPKKLLMPDPVEALLGIFRPTADSPPELGRKEAPSLDRGISAIPLGPLAPPMPRQDDLEKRKIEGG